MKIGKRLTVPATDPWHARAACAGTDTDVFFVSERNTDAVREARAICARCPVRPDCLTAAYAEDDVHTIRAGTTNRERRAFLRKADGSVPRAVLEATGDTYTLLRHIYDQYTRRDGEHVLWTDPRHWIAVRSKPYTVNQLAWLALHRRPSDGRVMRTCDQDGCVAEWCLTDRAMRDQVARRAA